MGTHQQLKVCASETFRWSTVVKRDGASERKAITFNDPNETKEKCLVVVTWKVRLVFGFQVKTIDGKVFSLFEAHFTLKVSNQLVD